MGGLDEGEQALMDRLWSLTDPELKQVYELAHKCGNKRIEDAAADEMDRRGISY